MNLSAVCTLKICVGCQNANESASYTVVSDRAWAPVRYMTMFFEVEAYC